jgi:hypothetical protein
MKKDDVLFDISILADNAKNILSMAEQSDEAEKLSAGFQSILWITLDYLHKIVEMAESADKEKALE